MIVVADAGPLNYLVLIGAQDLLPRLFRRVYAPPRVLAELRHPKAPPPVADWARRPPEWIVEQTPIEPALDPEAGPGELEAIALAHDLGAALLSDDQEAVALARLQGVFAFGTLGILQRAHAVGLVEIDSALDALRRTNYHHTDALFERVAQRAHEMRRES